MNKHDLCEEQLLINEFKTKFKAKMGYTPFILTKFNDSIDAYDIPLMTLDDLLKHFDDFLPVKYGIKLKLTSRNRTPDLCDLRAIFCHLARRMKYSLITIGRFLNSRDHTTVINSTTKFQNLLETSEAFQHKFMEIVEYIKTNHHESSTMDVLDQEQCES